MSLAAVAGLGAVAAYADAKFHVSKDWKEIRRHFRCSSLTAKAIASNRLSSWYLFEEQVKRKPAAAECIWSREGCYTWRETYGNSCRYAQMLRSLGMNSGDSVSLFMTNCPEVIFANLGAWALGCAPGYINFNLAGDALIHCLKLCRSKVLLVDEDVEVKNRIEESRGRIENELGMTIVILDEAKKAEIRKLAPTRPDDSFRDNLDPHGPICYWFTSGTTGFPKAVNITNGRMYYSFYDGPERIGVHDKDRFYVCMPLYHGVGGAIFMICATMGISVCIGKRFRVSTFWDEVRESRATAFAYVGETVRYLLAAPQTPQDKQHDVRVMFGNGIRPDVWKAFRDRFEVEVITEFFSSTEGVLGLTNQCRGDYLAHAVGHHGLLRRLQNQNRLASVPLSPTNTKEFLRRPDPPYLSTRTPYDIGGEILVRVPSTDPQKSGFAGYIDNEKATAERYSRDVLEEGDLWYRSGDALRRDDEGRWFFLDRLGDTFRWKGENVSTAEVSEVVGAFPGVLEANVYGVLLPNHDGRAGCAAIYLKEGPETFNWRGLAAFLSTKLPKYAIPVFFRVVSKLDITHNNKQNKVPLREEGVDMNKVKNGDRFFWRIPGAETYVEFVKSDWEKIVNGRARL